VGLSDDSPTATAIDGVHVFSSPQHADERGWFCRTLDLAWLDELGLDSRFVQQNQSRSMHRVLRGIHVRGGAGEAKLVRCASGSIVDNVIDVRPWSPTYLRTAQFVLDDIGMQHLYLPPFVAHGFQVTSPQADVCYHHSRPYEAGADLSFAWDDPDIGFTWPLADPIVSARDAEAPRLRDVDLDAVFSR
jgi:dTDP-4-dehydrorhamnose 3,5-epimerase